MFKFIQLTNGKKVSAFYEADEDQVAKIAGSKFDFKELNDGETAQKIAFVDADGNKIDIFKAPLVITDGNTVGWYVADDLTTITKDGSDFVSAWNDKLGSGRDLLQATGANQPTWVLNDGILFDGIDDFMKTAPFTFVQPEMIYIIFKQVSWGDNEYIIDGNSIATAILRQTGVAPQIGAYAGVSSATSSDLALNTYGIIRLLFNGVSSKLIINENTPITGDFGSINAGGFTLGATGAASAFSRIDVKEVILRKIADTTQNEQDIYDYLADKYSI